MLVENEIKNLREENSKLRQDINFYKQQCQKIESVVGTFEKQMNSTNKETTQISNSVSNSNQKKKIENEKNINNPNLDISGLILLKQEIKINELKFELESVREDYIIKEIAMRREYDVKKGEYELRISNLVSKLDLLEHKNDVYLKYETYMNELEKYNKDLIKNIQELQCKYDDDMEENKRTFHFNIDKVKKKMLNLINTTKSHFKSIIDEQVEYHSKMLLLQNTQLFDELAEQSKHLEELHIKIKEKDQQILSLEMDLEIQKNVQLILSGNNKKITEMIKSYFDEKNKNEEIREKEISTKITVESSNNYSKLQEKKLQLSLNDNYKDVSRNSEINKQIYSQNCNCICDCNCNCYLCSNKNNTISNIFNSLNTDNGNTNSSNILIINNKKNEEQIKPKIKKVNYLNISNPEVNSIQTDVEKTSNYINNETTKPTSEKEKYYTKYKKEFVLSKLKNQIKIDNDNDNNIYYNKNQIEKEKIQIPISPINNLNLDNSKNMNNTHKLFFPQNKHNVKKKILELNSEKPELNKNLQLNLENIKNFQTLTTDKNDEEILIDSNGNDCMVDFNKKNEIVDKVKKQISRMKYNKIFDVLNLKKSKQINDISKDSIFIGGDLLLTKYGWNKNVKLRSDKDSVGLSDLKDKISSVDPDNMRKNFYTKLDNDDSNVIDTGFYDKKYEDFKKLKNSRMISLKNQKNFSDIGKYFNESNIHIKKILEKKQKA